MMPDNTLWTFLSLLSGSGVLQIVGAWLIHVSMKWLGSRVFFIGIMMFLGAAMIGFSAA